MHEEPTAVRGMNNEKNVAVLTGIVLLIAVFGAAQANAGKITDDLDNRARALETKRRADPGVADLDTKLVNTDRLTLVALTGRVIMVQMRILADNFLLIDGQWKSIVAADLLFTNMTMLRHADGSQIKARLAVSDWVGSPPVGNVVICAVKVRRANGNYMAAHPTSFLEVDSIECLRPFDY